jgi:hypothetical protein
LAFVGVDELAGEGPTPWGSAGVVCVPVVVFFAAAAEGEVRVTPSAAGAAIPTGAVVTGGAA